MAELFATLRMSARLGPSFIGNTSHESNDRMGTNGVAHVGPRDLPTAGNFRLQDAEKGTRKNAVNSLVDFF